MGIFGLIDKHKKDMEKKMRDAGLDPKTGSLRKQQPIKPQSQAKPVRQKPKAAAKPCPVWIRDEDCARMGYKSR